MPLERLMERFNPSPEPETTRECPHCLSRISKAAHRCAFCTAEVSPGSLEPVAKAA